MLGALRYLVVWRDLSAEAERREHLVDQEVLGVLVHLQPVEQQVLGVQLQLQLVDQSVSLTELLHLQLQGQLEVPQGAEVLGLRHVRLL
ncbi:hypothetical protein EYF80_047569 [Liparis tanakae]|uniref:Uncharacterized protein n=1 Tax=Liparis tanakae TaxID=230148 RepID=A0A4Z2FNA8_9TELE|nr:hypothetical protein EYF80_047569 [Liparis tanakae]